jgi:prepilin-type N-terminal cleavage/methylation domain-containing protein
MLYSGLKMKFFLSDSKGYSLIEIIMVVLILGIAIPPIVNIFSQNLTNNVNSEIYTKANYFAEKKIEQILADKRSNSYSYIVAQGRYQNDTPETGFTRTIGIDDTNKIINGIPYAEIIVTVSHSNINNVVLTSWVTNYD